MGGGDGEMKGMTFLNYIQTERHMGKYNSVPFDGAGFKITGFIFSVSYSKAIEAIVTV